MLTTYEPHACIVVYSISDRESFNKAQDTLQYLASQTIKDKKVTILVGNKVDQEFSRQVSIQGKQKYGNDLRRIIKLYFN